MLIAEDNKLSCRTLQENLTKSVDAVVLRSRLLAADHRVQIASPILLELFSAGPAQALNHT